jgi:hypothetical protein
MKVSAFAHMPGPLECVTDTDKYGEYSARSAIYGVLSGFSLLILPITHGCVKVCYELGKRATVGAYNCGVASARLVKRASKKMRYKKNYKTYSDEIQLIHDLEAYDENQILFSDLFRKIIQRDLVRQLYPAHQDVYQILKLTFETQVACKNKDQPARLKKMIGLLESGELENIVQAYRASDCSAEYKY